ncbi:hypothetical protein DL771_001919 [Monosporascus sp. 5C6A]|nr:hypothetical protein DL771_001919 [Monosporascus sp. 5C6A]
MRPRIEGAHGAQREAGQRPGQAREQRSREPELLEACSLQEVCTEAHPEQHRQLHVGVVVPVGVARPWPGSTVMHPIADNAAVSLVAVVWDLRTSVKSDSMGVSVMACACAREPSGECSVTLRSLLDQP